MPRAETQDDEAVRAVVYAPIRRATLADAAQARACVVAAFEHYIDRIGKPPAPMLLDFEAEIRAGHVWLLSDEGGVVGALVQYETELGFYIDTVAVVPSSQGKGAGRALLAFAEQEAVRRGYPSIYLCTNARMTENQVFYPRLGFVEYERKTAGGYDRVFYRKQLAAAREPERPDALPGSVRLVVTKTVAVADLGTVAFVGDAPIALESGGSHRVRVTRPDGRSVEAVASIEAVQKGSREFPALLFASLAADEVMPGSSITVLEAVAAAGPQR